MICFLIQSLKKIHPNTSEQGKQRQRIYDLLNAETKPKFLYQRIQRFGV